MSTIAPSRALALSRALVLDVTASSLSGKSILIVEDNVIIAMDIAQAFEDCGANVAIANQLGQAMALAEQDGLSGAIVDHAIGTDNCGFLYSRLKIRNIPFVIYTGMLPGDDLPLGVRLIQKPAKDEVLVAAMRELLANAPRHV